MPRAVLVGKDRPKNNFLVCAFRSAKAATFAERKATIREFMIALSILAESKDAPTSFGDESE